MKYLSQFGRFWFDFIVGDDWTIAAAVALLVALTAAAAHASALAWPILPFGVATILGASLWRAHRAHARASSMAGATPTQSVDESEQ